MQTLSLLAPAKINLFLQVLGKRSDGYHNIQTVYQLLDVGDTLHFSLRLDDRLELQCDDVSLLRDDNVILQAARLLQQKADIKKGVNIVLEKYLPIGGGVGGGSSDAATTLLALNQLWECGFSLEQLAEYGTALGADVPVFVMGKSAWAEGTGIALTPIGLETRWYVVLTPPCCVSTQEIFQAPELTRNAFPRTIHAFLAHKKNEFFGVNDLQTVVIKRYPDVNEALNWLNDFSEARVTGSGASVFAAFSSPDSALEVLSKVPLIWRAFVAQGVNHSPVHTMLNK